MSEVVKLPNELTLYERAITIRSVEQKLLDLFAEGKLVGTVHTASDRNLPELLFAERFVPATGL